MVSSTLKNAIVTKILFPEIKALLDEHKGKTLPDTLGKPKRPLKRSLLLAIRDNKFGLKDFVMDIGKAAGGSVDLVKVDKKVIAKVIELYDEEDSEWSVRLKKILTDALEGELEGALVLGGGAQSAPLTLGGSIITGGGVKSKRKEGRSYEEDVAMLKAAIPRALKGAAAAGAFGVAYDNIPFDKISEWVKTAVSDKLSSEYERATATLVIKQLFANVGGENYPSAVGDAFREMAREKGFRGVVQRVLEVISGNSFAIMLVNQGLSIPAAKALTSVVMGVAAATGAYAYGKATEPEKEEKKKELVDELGHDELRRRKLAELKPTRTGRLGAMQEKDIAKREFEDAKLEWNEAHRHLENYPTNKDLQRKARESKQHYREKRARLAETGVTPKDSVEFLAHLEHIKKVRSAMEFSERASTHLSKNPKSAEAKSTHKTAVDHLKKTVGEYKKKYGSATAADPPASKAVALPAPPIPTTQPPPAQPPPAKRQRTEEKEEKARPAPPDDSGNWSWDAVKGWVSTKVDEALDFMTPEQLKEAKKIARSKMDVELPAIPDARTRKQNVIVPSVKILEPTITGDEQFDINTGFNFKLPPGIRAEVEQNPLLAAQLMNDAIRFHGGGKEEYNGDPFSIEQGNAELPKPQGKLAPMLWDNGAEELHPFHPNITRAALALAEARKSNVIPLDPRDRSLVDSILYGLMP